MVRSDKKHKKKVINAAQISNYADSEDNELVGPLNMNVSEADEKHHKVYPIMQHNSVDNKSRNKDLVAKSNPIKIRINEEREEND